MVDPGEMVTLTLQREFSEEALNSLALPAGERAQTHQRITQLFKGPGLQVGSAGGLGVWPGGAWSDQGCMV